MPRTRQDLDREAKVAQILEAAAARLRDGGSEALSIAAIARELGLAQNAVYWYFPSKDHLLVAAHEHIVRDIVARKPPRRRSAHAAVLWFVDQLAEIEHARAALHERARVSPVVAEFVSELHATWRRMLRNTLRDGLPDGDADVAVDALLATIQGVLTRRLAPAERRRIVAYALDRLTAPAGSAADSSRSAASVRSAT